MLIRLLPAESRSVFGSGVWFQFTVLVWGICSVGSMILETFLVCENVSSQRKVMGLAEIPALGYWRFIILTLLQAL